MTRTVLSSASDTAIVPDLDDLLCFGVYSTNLAFNRVYREPLEKLGLTYPQYLVMLVLWQEDDVPVGRISERLALDTSTLSPLLKRLEMLELLERSRDKGDERRVMLRLTDKGHALRAQVAEVLTCVVSAIGLPLDEIRDLNARLRRLRDHLRSIESPVAADPDL